MAQALASAAHRGVDVRVIVDEARSNKPSSQEAFLKSEGVAVKKIAADGRNLMHDKFVLFDRSLALTPSYNRSIRSLRETGSAEQLFTDEPTLVRQFQKEFEAVWHAADYARLP
jgi:phosphatidylserine/phosphatidylglycerophosphate/cardiolipin synthase-like enzyme